MRVCAGLGARHQRRYQVAVPVHLEKAVGIDGIASRLEHAVAERRVVALQPRQLVLVERRPAVARNAAFAPASGVVAAEELYRDIF